MLDRHILFPCRFPASFVVIEQVCGFGENSIVEYTQMAGGGHPVTVGSFLMIHHAERFVLVAVFEEIDCLVGDNIRCISFFYDVLSVFPEVRVVVVALLMLAAEYAPVVKSLRFADKMPFTDHGSLITGLLK